jgi:hypothetical protein
MSERLVDLTEPQRAVPDCAMRGDAERSIILAFRLGQ